jgi:hemin uptake protein HemP
MMNAADASNSGSGPSENRSCKEQFGKVGPAEPLIIESHDLFQGNVVIQIRHVDEIYTLRQTRLGKLILNK